MTQDTQYPPQVSCMEGSTRCGTYLIKKHFMMTSSARINDSRCEALQGIVYRREILIGGRQIHLSAKGQDRILILQRQRHVKRRALYNQILFNNTIIHGGERMHDRERGRAYQVMF